MIVKAEKMHLYVPTLYVYVYQKFDEKGRPVERKKRELCMAGANRSSKVARKIRSETEIDSIHRIIWLLKNIEG